MNTTQVPIKQGKVPATGLCDCGKPGAHFWPGSGWECYTCWTWRIWSYKAEQKRERERKGLA